MSVTLEQWSHRLKLNPDSDTTQRLYANRHLTVQEYIGQFRKGALNEVVPSEALQLKVEDVLKQGIVGGRNLRKLLVSGREKFQK